jgi:hypothetical protein
MARRRSRLCFAACAPSSGSVRSRWNNARWLAIAPREPMPALNSSSAARSAESAVGELLRARVKRSSIPVAAASAWASSRLRFDPNRWVNAGAESPTRSATAASVSPGGPTSVTTAVTALKIASSVTVLGLPVRMELTVAVDFMNEKKVSCQHDQHPQEPQRPRCRRRRRHPRGGPRHCR